MLERKNARERARGRERERERERRDRESDMHRALGISSDTFELMGWKLQH